MLRVFINKNSFEVVWTVLRRHGYDDELELNVPEHVGKGRNGKAGGGGKDGNKVSERWGITWYCNVTGTTLTMLTNPCRPLLSFSVCSVQR